MSKNVSELLKIKKIENKKDKIYRRAIMEENIIMQHPSLTLIVGSIGSGKTLLTLNLLERDCFYGKCKKDKNKPYFDTVFCFSGSAEDFVDQLVDKGIVKKQHLVRNPTQEDVQKVVDKQEQLVEEKGIAKSPRVLLLFDDVVYDQKLMKSKVMRQLATTMRQKNMSVWINSQYLYLVPKLIRGQSSALVFFRGNNKELEIINDEQAPSGLSKKEFLDLVDYATKDQYSFLFINKKAPHKERFRRNFDTILTLNI